MASMHVPPPATIWRREVISFAQSRLVHWHKENLNKDIVKLMATSNLPWCHCHMVPSIYTYGMIPYCLQNTTI